MASYDTVREGTWRLWLLPGHWNGALWTLIQARIAEQAPSKHPRTIRLESPAPASENVLFLKVFHHRSWATGLKDLMRYSKAVRALRQSAALLELGFHVPVAIAAGEQRQGGLLRRAFLLTLGIGGEPLPVYLQHGWLCGSEAMSLKQKRRALRVLATELRRFHELGFVHGDLVPSNVFVSEVPGSGVCFYLMDNDRTGKYPVWMPQRLWRRNLVQLNRFPLPGITLEDRMRFLRQYLSQQKWDANDRKLIFWLERKTRQRRWICDRVRGGKSFRELMRWDGPFAKAARS